MGLIAGWFVSCASAEQELSAEEMLKRCVKEGSVALVGELVLRNEWEQVIAKIATGEDEWIYVAECLSHGVYFGEDETAYGFFMPALAKALHKNPSDVLRLERSGVSLGDVCRLPFWEEDFAFVDDYVNQVLPVLDAKTVVGKRVNMDYAEICAFRMRDAYERIKAKIREREERERHDNSNTP